MVNDESLTGNFSKIIQENENTSNYAVYGLSLTGVVLLILILTKKKSKSK